MQVVPGALGSSGFVTLQCCHMFCHNAEVTRPSPFRSFERQQGLSWQVSATL